MKIHTVFISYKRLELLRQALESYFETITLPHSVVVVDNGSPGSEEMLTWEFGPVIYYRLKQNHYPGFACNRGWEMAPANATHLHRADNDFNFLPGWCEEVARRFRDPKLGQLGLRTDKQEGAGELNVGGNCVIRRDLWDAGLRYDETPWPELPVGFSEDSFFSPAVEKMGFKWRRARTTCITPNETVDVDDPYYHESWGARRIHGYGVE